MRMHQWFLISYTVILFCAWVPSPSLAQDNLPSIIKRIEPSVVVILTYDKEGKALGQGSGFFISQDGDVITNRHVIQGANRAEVKTSGGKVYPVKKVVAEDEEGDLVRVSTDVPEKAVKPLPISVSTPEVGEKIIVIGSPLGLERTVSDGIVSAVREIEAFGKIMQITAPISEGSSGSPVVNMKGEVVGVATFLIVKGQNLNFAIPGERVSRLKPGKGKTLAEWEAKRVEEWLTTPEGLFFTGAVFALKEDCENALSFLEEAVKKNPLFAEAYSLIAYCNNALGRFTEAVEASEKAISIKPDIILAYLLLGEAYQKLGRYQEALEIYQQTIRIKPDRAGGYAGLGNIYFDLERYKEAIEAFRQAIRIKPDSPDVYYLMGLAYIQLVDPDGRWSEARDAFKEALNAFKEGLRLDPDNADIHARMGDVYMILERQREAVDSFRQAIRIKPDYAWAHFELGYAYYVLGDKGSALEEYKILKEMDVDLANRLFDLIYK